MIACMFLQQANVDMWVWVWQRTERAPKDRNIAETDPARFAQLLIEKLDKEVEEREAVAKVEEKLRMLNQVSTTATFLLFTLTPCCWLCLGLPSLFTLVRCCWLHLSLLGLHSHTLLLTTFRVTGPFHSGALLLQC